MHYFHSLPFPFFWYAHTTPFSSHSSDMSKPSQSSLVKFVGPSCYSSWHPFIHHPSASSLARCQPAHQNSNLPHWLITLSTPLSQLTSTPFLATTSRHVLYAPPTPICCRFLRSTQTLLPAVLALLPPQYGTHYLLAFTLVLHQIHSVVFLRDTVSSRPSVPPSDSHKCLRFGLLADTVHFEGFYIITYLPTNKSCRRSENLPVTICIEKD